MRDRPLLAEMDLAGENHRDSIESTSNMGKRLTFPSPHTTLPFLETVTDNSNRELSPVLHSPSPSPGPPRSSGSANPRSSSFQPQILKSESGTHTDVQYFSKRQFGSLPLNSGSLPGVPNSETRRKNSAKAVQSMRRSTLGMNVGLAKRASLQALEEYDRQIAINPLTSTQPGDTPEPILIGRLPSVESLPAAMDAEAIEELRILMSSMKSYQTGFEEGTGPGQVPLKKTIKQRTKETLGIMDRNYNEVAEKEKQRDTMSHAEWIIYIMFRRMFSYDESRQWQHSCIIFGIIFLQALTSLSSQAFMGAYMGFVLVGALIVYWSDRVATRTRRHVIIGTCFVIMGAARVGLDVHSNFVMAFWYLLLPSAAVFLQMSTRWALTIAFSICFCFGFRIAFLNNEEINEAGVVTKVEEKVQNESVSTPKNAFGIAKMSFSFQNQSFLFFLFCVNRLYWVIPFSQRCHCL